MDLWISSHYHLANKYDLLSLVKPAHLSFENIDVLYKEVKEYMVIK